MRLPYRPSRRPASSRDRIFAAAKMLFAAQGYENTSTAAISRMAGTSESQLMKHFGGKYGLLEAVFIQGWGEINVQARQDIEGPRLPQEKLRVAVEAVFKVLEKDPELKLLMLFESRRIRGDGHAVSLTGTFLEFVRLLDGILHQIQTRGLLRPDRDPQAVRSALMGMMEGLLRDQMLAERIGYPAHYGRSEVSEIFSEVLASFMVRRPRSQPRPAAGHHPS